MTLPREPFRPSPRLDYLLLFLFGLVLVLPLFKLKYLDQWGSIESTFIADARMLREHLPHPGWQPLWYCGTRFDYIYPPALRYGTALISTLDHLSPARAYHIYIALLYATGIVSIYALVLVGSGSRLAAWLAALATALTSPSFLLLQQIRHDSAHWVPQRLHVLMQWGEGPHISALSVLPFALALCFVALRKWNPATFAWAGVLCAFTVANNFYGATSLAMFFPLVVWSIWVGTRDASMLLRAAGIPVLAYLLSAFWLTPSYLKITAVNLDLVATPGNTPSRLVAAAAIAAYCALSFWWANRRPERQWAIFVAGSAVVLCVYVLGLYYFGLHIVGEPPRLVPELDLALILLSVEMLRRLWSYPRLRGLALVLVILAFLPSVRYVRHLYSPFPKARAALKDQYEYKIASWVQEHLAGLRVQPSGSVRFWFNAWFDNPQPTGGSDQGTLNRILPIANYQITAGDRADLAVLWLQSLGSDAVIVGGQNALDQYRDYRVPEKFRGVLTPLYDDQHGTVIYQVPRIHPGIGRLVDTGRMAALKNVHGGDDLDGLRDYIAAVEDPAQGNISITWKNFDEADIQAGARAGQSVLVQETYDSSWRAYAGGKVLPVRLEPVMNFMLIDVPEGPHRIRLRFETPLENRLGQGLFLLALVLTAALIYRGRQYA